MIQTKKSKITAQNVLSGRESIVNTLRTWSNQSEIKDDAIIIPDGCEKFGFIEGKYSIGTMLHFLADMLEE
jgi:hypothetical protein